MRAFFDHFPQRPLKFGKRRVESRASRINDDIPGRREFGAMEAKRFADAALDAVTNHRAAKCSGTSEADSDAIGFRSRQTKCREQRTGNADAVVINESKIGGSQNPARTRKRDPAAGGFRRPWQSERLFRR